MADSIPTDLLRVNELARKLQVHPSTIYRWMDQGALPYYGRGRTRRVSESEATATLRQERGRTPPPRIRSARARTAGYQRALEALRKRGMNVENWPRVPV